MNVKRILLFLVLFCSGLTLLLWIDEPDERGPGAQERPNRPADDETIPDSSAGGIVFAPDGAFDYASRNPLPDGTRPLLYTVSGNDSRTIEGGLVEGLDCRFELFDVEGGALRAVVIAQVARMQLATGGARFDLQIGEHVELQEVVVTLYEGAPVSPIELRTSTLSGSIEDQTFQTDAPAVVTAEGFEATGTGLDVNMPQGRFAFLREGRATITRSDGTTAELSCAGELSVQRDVAGVDGAPGAFTVRAVEDAHLEVSGRVDVARDELLEVDADEIRAVGREGSDQVAEDEADSRFGLDRLYADGHVTVRAAGGAFVGERARVEVAEGGELGHATIEGSPRALIPLEGSDLALVGPEDEAVPVEVVGSTTIEIERLVRDGREIDELRVPGPARVVWDEVTLDAKGGITGEAAADAELSTFRAVEDVVLAWSGGRLTCPELNATLTVTQSDERRVDALASPPCRIRGTTRAGKPYRITTSGPLAIELEGERWRVPSAEGVELVVLDLEDVPEVRAVADRVTDFDPIALTYEARGSVELHGVREGEKYLVRGEELDALAIDRAELRGGEGPAHFESALVRGTARRVERIGDRLIATGDVHSVGAEGEGAYELDCDELVAQRTDERSGDGELTRSRSKVEARGDVRGSFTFPTRAYDVACAELVLERVEHHAQGELVEATSHLVARALERGTIRFVEAESADAGAGAAEPSEQVWVVSSDELVADRVEGADDLVLHQDVVAEGNVRVTHAGLEGAEFQGRGDRLRLTGRQSGRLESTGDRRVEADGSLPGLAHPFDMEADWLEFDEANVRAAQPDIRVLVLSAPGEAGETDPPRPVRARAFELIANEESLLFSGDVRIDGELSPGRTWWLESAFARIVARAEDEDDAAPPEPAPPAPADDEAAELPFGGRIDAIYAWGGFAFAIEDSIHGAGDTLTAVAATGKLHLTGAPARLSYGRFQEESSWFEFDTRYNLSRSGPGSIRPSSVPRPRPSDGNER